MQRERALHGREKSAEIARSHIFSSAWERNPSWSQLFVDLPSSTLLQSTLISFTLMSKVPGGGGGGFQFGGWGSQSDPYCRIPQSRVVSMGVALWIVIVLCIYTYTCVYIYIYVCIYIYIHIYVYVYTYRYTYTNTICTINHIAWCNHLIVVFINCISALLILSLFWWVPPTLAAWKPVQPATAAHVGVTSQLGCKPSDRISWVQASSNWGEASHLNQVFTTTWVFPGYLARSCQVPRWTWWWRLQYIFESSFCWCDAKNTPFCERRRFLKVS